MSNRSRTLYTGVTSDLQKRVAEHKLKLLPGFTSVYNVTRLVYFEDYGRVHDAIAREKQIKGWVRRRKVALIITGNPTWRDLSERWYGNTPGLSS